MGLPSNVAASFAGALFTTGVALYLTLIIVQDERSPIVPYVVWAFAAGALFNALR